MANGPIRRGLIFFALILALPSSRGQAGSRALYGDSALVEPDHTEKDGVAMQGIEKRRRAKNRKGPALVSTEPESGSEANASGGVLQTIDLAGTRDYLNALVAESVSSGDQQLSNLAFFKTHKTGSTSLASIFYRYGVRHNLKVARYTKEGLVPLPVEEAFPKILEECDGRVDIMPLHIGSSTQHHIPWREATEQFKTIMRDPDDINFVTIFRDPRSHFLSYYYYFICSNIGYKPVEQFLLDAHGADDHHWQEIHNPSAAELGITTQQQLEDFVENDLPNFKLVLLTERFDEGLMVLRNLLGWRLIDMSYITLNQTVKTNRFRKPNERQKGGLGDRLPTFDELSIQAQNKIDELTSLDRVIYEAGKVHYEKTLAPLARQVTADIAWFNPLQELVTQYLHSNKTSSAEPMYTVADVSRFYPPAAPF